MGHKLFRGLARGIWSAKDYDKYFTKRETETGERKQRQHCGAINVFFKINFFLDGSAFEVLFQAHCRSYFGI